MTIETEVQSLRQVSMFREIDPARLKLLAFTSDRLSYEDGEVLFRQNEVSDSTYVVIDGKVEVWLEAQPQRIKLTELHAGQMVGEMGVLCDQPRSATIQAGSHVVVLKIGREVFFEMLRQFPQMSVAVMRDLARRQIATNDRLSAANKELAAAKAQLDAANAKLVAKA